MTAIDLIAELQKMPPLYEVEVFARGVEIEDFYQGIVGVERDVMEKKVMLEFDPTSTNKFPH
jgi:hypothetical protein